MFKKKFSLFGSTLLNKCGAYCVLDLFPINRIQYAAILFSNICFPVFVKNAKKVKLMTVWYYFRNSSRLQWLISCHLFRIWRFNYATKAPHKINCLANQPILKWSMTHKPLSSLESKKEKTTAFKINFF